MSSFAAAKHQSDRSMNKVDSSNHYVPQHPYFKHSEGIFGKKSTKKMTTLELKEELKKGKVSFNENDTVKELREAVETLRKSKQKRGSLLKKMMKSVAKRTAKKIVKAAIGL